MDTVNNLHAKYAQELWELIDSRAGTNAISGKMFYMFWAAYKLGVSTRDMEIRQSTCKHDMEYNKEGGYCKLGCGHTVLQDSSD